jgi:integrase
MISTWTPRESTSSWVLPANSPGSEQGLTMQVSDRQATALRALLAGTGQEAASAAARLTDEDMRAYELLLQASLTLTSRQRFASGYTSGDVIRCIARVRAGTPARSEDMDLDPLAAEALLRRALGQQSSGPRIVAFFATIYYAGLRPEEAINLGKENLIFHQRKWNEEKLWRGPGTGLVP